ncbi:MAG: DEAD/DEAH box helicase [Limisphaerales bacterium]
MHFAPGGYLPAVQTLAEQLSGASVMQRVTVPDLWQQQAVAALRDGRDVVVQAPTGAGKTLIFELWSNQGKPRGQAIYTVPTRALANDKLAEWRARGWNVGIATGDLAENLDAPVLVATLETQKPRLIRGEGPTLLVVDEYQLIADPDRGLNYELSIALAPPQTQLLLLSGSVSNPHHVVHWLNRLGRRASLIRHEERPVPLEEVHANQLSYQVPAQIRGYWPRLCAKALAEDLGPILLFAPRRAAAEALAAELARNLPTPNPLTLTAEQKQLVGEHLARLLRARVAYHHSGLSYAARAGVIEPLAKAGQLRVVVATMGLAAGINFSLRSVALTDESYRREAAETALRSDEILQMFGRAGRRGLDEVGYVIVAANEVRLTEAHTNHLSRSATVDWGALLGIMAAAADAGKDPFREAVRVQQRLFTTKPVFLGVEKSLQHPDTPCGLQTDAERARLVRRKTRELWNSRGEWQPMPTFTPVKLKELFVPVGTPDGAAPELSPLLSQPTALDKFGHGGLLVIGEENGMKIYGRAVVVAEVLNGGRVLLAKWARKLANWSLREVSDAVWETGVAPALAAQLEKTQHTPVVRFSRRGHQIVAEVSLGELTALAAVDAHGVALWKPKEREVMNATCAACALVQVCRATETATGTALLWRRLGLVDARGVPTRRGRLVSFFHQGDGLALAAALEDESYPLDELIYDLANLDAGFRFCGDDNRWAGRLAVACHEAFKLQTIPGYLENGLPPKYGFGGETVVRVAHRNPEAKAQFITPVTGMGDIDRVIIEWRSLLRQISHAPTLDWPRWRALQAMARGILEETSSPTLTDLPPLEPSQTQRVDHRLQLRRH